MAADWFDTLPKDRLLAELSIWSADLGRLSDDIARAERYADLWHVDACDGHFAPQLLIFPDMVAVLRRLSTRPIHVHLMVDSAILLAQIEQFADVGADLITVHCETEPGVLDRALGRIVDRRLKAGIVLTLDTPVENVAPYLARVDFVTMVGTPIGIKGVSPEAATYDRLRQARALIDQSAREHRPVLAADGGIRENTVQPLREAGADTVVMGSLAFGAPDLAARMRWLHGL
jgi:ribulose-phosphate 3-epimerase